MLQSVFPKTIRGKIILYTAAVTCSIAVFTVTICSFVFQSFLQKNQIQTSEYSLEVICNSTAADLENILSFYNGAPLTQISPPIWTVLKICPRCPRSLPKIPAYAVWHFVPMTV